MKAVIAAMVANLRGAILALAYALGRLVRWVEAASTRLTRSVLRLGRPRRPGQRRRQPAGFILPTTALLLVVVALTITALSLRSLNRTTQVAGDRQQKIIYNAATPAIDRAKAKLEKLFTSDPRVTPSGVPPQEFLLSMMRNDGEFVPDLDVDPYTLPDEDRIDLGDNINAWRYEADTDGNGEEDADIIYSVIFTTPTDVEVLADQSNRAIADRAEAGETRTGPMVAGDVTGPCNIIERVGEDVLPPIENGWFQSPNNTSTVRKNFQVDAVVVPKRTGEDQGVSAGIDTIATLEFQQDKIAERGNKWGAWFRNDLEIFPGPEFNWNGAMHTEGSLMVAGRAGKINLYLVSSPNSCLMSDGNRDASLITAAQPLGGDFQGQFMAAGMAGNKSVGFNDDRGATVHYMQEKQPIFQGIEGNNLKLDTHSVNEGAVSGPWDIALDPLALFTEDESVMRRANPDVVRSGAWGEGDSEAMVKGRFENKQQPKPYLDDFYRADDRLGPRPTYGNSGDRRLPDGSLIGENISGSGMSDPEELIRNSNEDDRTGLGLDGYWERRAAQEGLRILVGQRFEMGSNPAHPWAYPRENDEFDNRRPHETLQRRSQRDELAAVQSTLLYHHGYDDASDDSQEPVAGFVSTVHPGTPETLKNASTFEKPPAPFAIKTELQGPFGATFGDDENEWLFDFFNGRGTNGWEFDVSDLDPDDTEMNRALTNLANFAGDPDGAFPALQESGKVHPVPEMAKWGNFSELRRAIDDDNGSLADESYRQTAALTLGALAYNISYLNGLDYTDPDVQIVLERLANSFLGTGANPDDPQFFPDDIDIDNENDLTPPFDSGVDLYESGGTRFVKVYSGGQVIPGSEDGIPLVQVLPDGSTEALYDSDDPDTLADVAPPEAYIAALGVREEDAEGVNGLDLLRQDRRADVPPPAGMTPAQQEAALELQTWARLIATKEQVNRDRTFGFANPKFGLGEELENPIDKYDYKVQFSEEDVDGDGVLDPDEDSNSNGILDTTVLSTPYEIGATYRFECNFSADDPVNNDPGNNYFGLGRPGNLEDEKKFLALATALCPVAPKYPSLYYVFPKETHDFLGTMTGTTAEEQDRYLSDANVQAAAGTNFEALTDPEIADMAAIPLAPNDWVAPHEDATPSGDCADSAPLCMAENLIRTIDADGTESFYRLGFKDTAFFDGRDLLPTRSLNVDVDMIRDGQYSPGEIGSDTWLAGGEVDAENPSQGGIIYAFREDAQREDAIARPASTGWDAYQTNPNRRQSRMFVSGRAIQDPPVNPETGISAKPVDYYPDPDRRAHSFRLINGESVERIGAGAPSGKENIYGMSFITDNPLYVKGDLNLHEYEEFTQELQDNFNNFYFRDRLEPAFADPEQDPWRPVELLADVVSPLSDAFCDGSILDAYMAPGSPEGWNQLAGNGLRDRYGCDTDTNVRFTSYHNQNKPDTQPTDRAEWVHENPFDIASPIVMDFVGQPLEVDDSTRNWRRYGESGENYQTIAARDTDDQGVPVASETTQNAVFVSGTGVSRQNQSYGGLHNFPAFLENWGGGKSGNPLWISGAFLQLNFRTYSTGPYEPDAFEAREEPAAGGELQAYYRPPPRRWGYDVALQYAPAGPIASRFITLGNTRSEFYDEPPADDPYICLLRAETESPCEE